MNYDYEMTKQLDNIALGEKILLHVCCAPCSSACIERLGEHFEIVLYFYNPNITNEKEYRKRLDELNKFVSKIKTKFGVSVIEGKYDPKSFFEISKGLEDEPERGKRCYKCYRLRLENTASKADELGIKYFATSLTLSPYKKVNWVNEIGETLDDMYDATYLYSDFKKKNGYKRSIELSKEYNLYRQDYCGCAYSLRDKRD